MNRPESDPGQRGNGPAKCFAGQGPSMKRTRPAPMGRAFRVVKRMAHLTVEVAERPVKSRAAESPAAPTRRGAKKAKD